MVESAEDEQSWIARCRKGDHAAFEALVRRYQVMVHALTYRMTGSHADAQDLAQEAFIAAYDQIGSFQGGSRFSTWLYRIATNRCLNSLKSRERRDRAYQAYLAEADHAVDPPEGEGARAVQVIQAALLRLDPGQRAAIVLTTYDGLSHAEAAAVLGCAETTVSWRVFSARRKLKRWLAPLAKGLS